MEKTPIFQWLAFIHLVVLAQTAVIPGNNPMVSDKKVLDPYTQICWANNGGICNSACPPRAPYCQSSCGEKKSREIGRETEEIGDGKKYCTLSDGTRDVVCDDSIGCQYGVQRNKFNCTDHGHTGDKFGVLGWGCSYECQTQEECEAVGQLLK